jgi:predicted 2-oxoglutarate/Fe(II)-dependent dioxygenase YbiX
MPPTAAMIVYHMGQSAMTSLSTGIAPGSRGSRKAAYDLFAKLGVFIIPGFINREECAWLRHRIDETGEEKVSHPLAAYKVHQAPSAAASIFRERFLGLASRLSGHFGLPLVLDADEPLTFRIFRPGDFAGPHVDRHAGAIGGFDASRREISALAYLSTEAAEPGEGRHVGGTLILYDLLAGFGSGKIGLPLPAQEGLLIAFSIDRLHEVRSVLSGVRYTMSAFFSRATAPERAGPSFGGTEPERRADPAQG